MITNLEPVVIANTTEFFRTHAGLTATIPRRERTLQVRLKHLLVHTLSKLQTVQNSNRLF
jgi:hypothetical protein